MKNVFFNGWMSAHIQTNSCKLENIGSKVRRHEHEVKGLPIQGNVLWIQTVPVKRVLKLFPKSTVHLSDIISK